MRADTHILGHTLIELLFALALISVCIVVGLAGVVGALRALEARTSAQAWQAAASAAQSRAVWTGYSTRVASAPSGFSLPGSPAATDGSSRQLGHLPTQPSVNVGRWRAATGTVVTFVAGSAAPDSGGSLFFGSHQTLARVVVRVGSGLTTRGRP